jgi:uncharacterized membrane protein YkvA (DUF1232 family)
MFEVSEGVRMRQPGRITRSRLRNIFNRERLAADGKRIERAVKKAGRMMGEFEKKGIPQGLRQVWTDVKDIYSMLRDSIRGDYSVPFRTMAAVAVTLLYLANPFDLIPDFLPGIGYIDDVFIVSLCVKFISEDLDEYRQWKSSGAEEEPLTEKTDT